MVLCSFSPTEKRGTLGVIFASIIFLSALLLFLGLHRQQGEFVDQPTLRYLPTQTRDEVQCAEFQMFLPYPQHLLLELSLLKTILFRFSLSFFIKVHQAYEAFWVAACLPPNTK